MLTFWLVSFLAQVDPPPLVAAPGVEAVPEAQPTEQVISVHIASDEIIELRRYRPVSGWAHFIGYEPDHFICVTPCTFQVSPELAAADYHVSTPILTDSGSFSLDGYGPRVDVKVHTGRSDLKALGKVATIAGAIIFGIGDLAALVGFTDASLTGFRAPGVIGGGIGLGMLVTGIVLMIVERTVVSISESLLER